MTTETTPIDGLIVVRWSAHEDERGSFRQTHQVSEIAQTLGREVRLLQGNHARSRPGVVRGLHAEPWDKLVYVTRGTAQVVVADIRPDSATFGQHAGFLLGDPPGEPISLFVSEGLAHGYAVQGTREIDFLYQVSAEWRVDADKRAVAWDDPDLAIEWPVDPAEAIISAEDRANPTLRERFGDHPRLR